jgi:uncharacterized membrane protein
MTAKTKIIYIYVATVIGIMTWIGAIFLAPYLKSQSSPIAEILYAVFSPTCHQIPSRCFYAFGFPTAVCSRCFGIYAGFLLGTLIFPVKTGFSTSTMPKSRSFIILSIPIVIDAAGNLLGIWTSADWLRFLTGIIWGSILPLYFLAGLTDLLLRNRKKYYLEIGIQK